MTSTLSGIDLETVRNRTFDAIVVCDCASIERTLTASDIQLSRADPRDSRIASCAVALVLARQRPLNRAVAMPPAAALELQP